MCTSTIATAISYLLILLDTILSKYCDYDLIKCMLTLSDQSYIASYTPAIILSINILFPFFRLEQNIVRQGIFAAIRFHGSPKWCKFVISILWHLIFMDFTILAAKCSYVL